MNWLDIIVLLILAIPTLIGLSRGLIRTVLPLFGIMLGVFLAGRFYGAMGGWLGTWLESEAQADIIGFLVVFGLTLGVVIVISELLSKFVKLTLLGWVDRLGGALLGLVVGAFIASVILAGVTKFEFAATEGVVQNSFFAELFLEHLPFILGFLPGEFDAVRQFFS